ncbi:hypothetical protein CORC01_08904 [Colletotrichum orchidophilum]|uniref:Uncharacterized protein n=1 Tax=Colletotrichum orchidophilum TaxID=1209926 RepID=A0A1G4B345_9PEZI|nr:uncharacterized protein CORC01_08904 [Colletotrichum orchidophilum]OHE95763.1 hypothetical protein CORC01_08904 [Colletotrichum orchidophilum]
MRPMDMGPSLRKGGQATQDLSRSCAKAFRSSSPRSTWNTNGDRSTFFPNAAQASTPQGDCQRSPACLSQTMDNFGDEHWFERLLCPSPKPGLSFATLVGG